MGLSSPEPDQCRNDFGGFRPAPLCGPNKRLRSGLDRLPSAPLDDLLALAYRLGIRQDMVCTGFVAAEDLPAVYTLAEVLVHPTSVNGFGFGLEAMACGTPFITSDMPGVVEAVADAALKVPPQNLPALREALGSLLADEKLARGSSRLVWRARRPIPTGTSRRSSSASMKKLGREVKR